MDDHGVARLRLIGSYCIMKMLQIQFAVFPTAVLQQDGRSLAGSCNTPQILKYKIQGDTFKYLKIEIQDTTKGTRKILFSGFFLLRGRGGYPTFALSFFGKMIFR